MSSVTVLKGTIKPGLSCAHPNCFLPFKNFIPGSTIPAIFHNLLPGGKLEEEELFIFIISLMSLFINSFFSLQLKPFFYCFRVYTVLLSPATVQNPLLVASKNLSERNLESTFVPLLWNRWVGHFADNSLLRYLYIHILIKIYPYLYLYLPLYFGGWTETQNGIISNTAQFCHYLK